MTAEYKTTEKELETMAQIERSYLDKLTNAGLHVSPPVKAFRDGVWVGKPTSTNGNSIEGYKAGYVVIGNDPAPPKMDAPMLKFHKSGAETWIVRGDDYVGGQGPGDFKNEWETVEEAIEDILDFFFGEPSRMKEKAEGRNQIIVAMKENS